MSKIQIILAGLGALMVLGFTTVTVGSGHVVTESRAISPLGKLIPGFIERFLKL